MVTVAAPGSSANLGPGFDVLGVAIDRHAVASTEPITTPRAGSAGRSVPEDSGPCDAEHLARVAFEAAGGTGPLWFDHDLLPGRGLGFSAAARAAGAVAGGLVAGLDLEVARQAAYVIVSDLEGHADNAAPAVFGGLQIATAERAHTVTAGFPGALWCWVPQAQTSTDSSRVALGSVVDRADAVDNLGRVALLMAALYEGQPHLLREATADSLHQDVRFAAQPESAAVLQAGLDHGAICGWLSGSGPSVALIVEEDHAGEVSEAVASATSAAGELIQVGVDQAGAVPV